MREKYIPINLFNDIWISCYYNNLISILLSNHVKSNFLPAMIKSSYKIRILKDEMDKGFKEIHFTLGWLMLMKKFTHFGQLDDAFMNKEVKIEDFTNSAESIKKHIHEGNYVFFPVNRYFLKGGVNYKKDDFFHLALFTGYSDEKKQFQLSEDCVKPGLQQIYDLDYEALDQSNHYFKKLNEEKNRTGEFYVINHKSNINQIKIPVADIIAEFKNHLLSTSDERELFTDYEGIEVLKLYEETFYEAMSDVRQLDNLYFYLSEPIQHIQLRIYLIHFIQSQLNINKMNYLEVFNEIKKKWDQYRNIIQLSYIRNPDRQNFQNNLKNKKEVISTLIEGIYKLEKNVTETLIVELDQYKEQFLELSLN
ncbi:hypothetical protein [Chengkuizengella axinellae]|uniref:Butirosin biosynthesis protein H N-terminal domain-containing protein n=1 Tax=Chengkuizengella axinellae TaxID=3064388 RepID=A0ABT9IZ04_9BACL|nr:hypothetical protein [Chengkuizengella sp. 2205SS18-9]MDP5274600.1 hypothetical protein [Chengkuizengella sp. 2205SS18-9]